MNSTVDDGSLPTMSRGLFERDLVPFHAVNEAVAKEGRK